MSAFTHRGWFGICPVYLGRLDQPEPVVHERRPWMLPLMLFSECMYGIVFWVIGLVRPDYEPAWPIQVTGRLPTPIPFESI